MLSCAFVSSCSSLQLRCRKNKIQLVIKINDCLVINRSITVRVVSICCSVFCCFTSLFVAFQCYSIHPAIYYVFKYFIVLILLFQESTGFHLCYYHQCLLFTGAFLQYCPFLLNPPMHISKQTFKYLRMSVCIVQNLQGAPTHQKAQSSSYGLHF